jgi:hypothetical protein
MEFLHMPKELDGSMVPNEEEFLRKCGHDDHALKEVWEGWGSTE